MTHLSDAIRVQMPFAPSNVFATDKALNLLDKHLKWYGFTQWAIGHLYHNDNGILIAEISNVPVGTVCTASIDTHTGKLKYQIEKR